ncbi:hypothetical protein E4U30_003388, partial [Claviceps sp. LM220 group G6]
MHFKDMGDFKVYCRMETVPDQFGSFHKKEGGDCGSSSCKHSTKYRPAPKSKPASKAKPETKPKSSKQ